MALEAKLDVLLADSSSSAYEAQQLAVTIFKRKQKLSQPGGAALIARAVAALARRGEDAVSSALAAELAAFLKVEKKNKRTPEPGTEAAVETILNALSGDSAKVCIFFFFFFFFSFFFFFICRLLPLRLLEPA